MFRLHLCRCLELDDGDAARQDGVINVGYAVGGHKQQAVEVLEGTQKLSHDGVVLQIVVAAANVDVGLVEQEHRVPARSAPQDFRKVGFH